MASPHALPDVAIAGAGIIGLALARSLAHAGLRVLVLTQAAPLDQASQAAAGMLAVNDPENPPELLALSRLSRSLYPAFLESLAADSGHALTFQTHRTLQLAAHSHPTLPRLAPAQLQTLLPTAIFPSDSIVLDLEEVSLDPRELAAALLASLAAQPRIELRPFTTVQRIVVTPTGVLLHTADQQQIAAAAFVDCTGAWSLSSSLLPSLRVSPRKGQMLTLPTPPALAQHGLVLRSPEIYLVPRLHGPRAGHTVLGATVEDAGFSNTVEPGALDHLLTLASRLLPELRSAPILSSWAGLRPATPDSLPLLGQLPLPSPQCDPRTETRPNTQRLTDPSNLPLFIASGHFRNGILLAPGTAAVLTDLLLGRTPSISLEPLSPARFCPQTSPPPAPAQQHTPPSVV